MGDEETTDSSESATQNGSFLFLLFGLFLALFIGPFSILFSFCINRNEDDGFKRGRYIFGCSIGIIAQIFILAFTLAAFRFYHL